MSDERSMFALLAPSKKLVAGFIAVATLYNSLLAGKYYSQVSKNHDFQDLPVGKADAQGGAWFSTRNMFHGEEARRDGKLNIVLLYADDWSFNTLGSLGRSPVKTPALDRMAKSGMLFTSNCVVTSWMNVTMYEPGRWNQTLYPLAMKAGYHVGFFGKYHHLEPPPRDVPTFSEYRSMPYDHFVERDGKLRHITEWNEIDSLRFLETRPRNKPFFLTTSFFATHAEDGSVSQYRPMESSSQLYENETIPTPKTFTEKHWNDMPPFFSERNEGRVRFHQRYNNPDMYQTMMKKTYRMATEVDAVCGRILDVLEKQGVLNNTLVIFTTDNGNMHGEKGLAEKWYAYEESLRVPLIIFDPRMPKENVGTKNDAFTLNIDLAPTILSAAGVTPPDVMQGRDIADLYLRPKTSPQWRQEFLYEFWANHPGIPNSLALVQKGFKYIYWTDNDYHQAFNLEIDPLEENDMLKGKLDEGYTVANHRMQLLSMAAKNGLPL